MHELPYILKELICLLGKDRLEGKRGNRRISSQAISVIQTVYDGGLGRGRSDESVWHLDLCKK